VLKSTSVASHTQDDGFHEIQLNGKQLVFLFMAVSIASVVIFLFGVAVGRGVRAERGGGSESAALAEAPTADPARETTGSVITPGQDPTRVPAPPPARDDLSYPDRLGKSTPADESLKSGAAKAAATATFEKPAAPAAPKEAPPPKEASPAASVSGPPGPGFAVQVAALNVRSEADAIARRLAAKGYSAYVQPPVRGTPTVYRVRVGTFKTRREADNVAARLKKEEKFTPWVTR
jgi:septal ring-binding cell division protein DamX